MLTHNPEAQPRCSEWHPEGGWAYGSAYLRGAKGEAQWAANGHD